MGAKFPAITARGAPCDQSLARFEFSADRPRGRALVKLYELQMLYRRTPSPRERGRVASDFARAVRGDFEGWEERFAGLDWAWDEKRRAVPRPLHL